MSDHLTEVELRAFTGGQLPPDDLLRADEHLSRCEQCRSRASAVNDTAMKVRHLRAQLSVPMTHVSDDELQRVLVDAIDQLPDHFRTVFVLRAVQGLSIEETAESLDLNEETVKTRLHRARHLLQRTILSRAEPQVADVLPFPAPRCDRVVSAVLHRLGIRGPHT